MHVGGRPELLADVGFSLATGELTQDIGAAIASGVAMSAAFEAAEAGLGRALVALAETADGSLHFDGTELPPSGSFPLPTSVLRLLAHAFASDEREPGIDPANTQRLTWRGPAEVRGMNPVEQRIHQLAQKHAPAGELIEAIGRKHPERGRQAAAAIEMMIAAGLVALRDAPPESRTAKRMTRQEQEAERRVRALREKIARRKQESADSHHRHKTTDDLAEEAALAQDTTERDTAPRSVALVELEDVYLIIKDQEPLKVLALDTAESLDNDSLTAAFRDACNSYHPDRYAAAEPELRDAASKVFELINSAFEYLRDPSAMAYANKVLAAQAKGEIYIDEIKAGKAKVYYRQAESALKKRNTQLACDLAERALGMDPRPLEYHIFLVSCQVFNRAIEPEAGLLKLADMNAESEGDQVMVYFATGRLLKFIDRDDDAVKFFRKVLRIQRDHADAKREIWLYDKRSNETENAKTRIASFFGRRD